MPHHRLTDARCPECGAPIPVGGACRDHFGALLAFEWQVEGAGEREHFLLVATYLLQHPVGSRLTDASLAELRAGVADILEGRATLAGFRRRVARLASGSVRVTRRDGDTRPAAPGRQMSPTVADVRGAVEAGADYGETVERWARSVCG